MEIMLNREYKTTAYLDLSRTRGHKQMKLRVVDVAEMKNAIR